MPWECKKVEHLRKELIESYLGGLSMTELSRKFGISRKTAYKWYERYLRLGKEGIKDLSKAPHNPCRIFSEERIGIAIQLKLKYPHWGPKKIVTKLKRDYPSLLHPSPTRLYTIFKNYNLTIPRRLRKDVPATHPLGEMNGSNDVWMADFKGWFWTQDNVKCEPLTITDGHSRYLIRCMLLERKSIESVWPIFKEAFLEYGLPLRIRTDNGPPFGCIGAGRLTKLSINFIKAGVLPEWINPGHPEENGRHERFHRTLKEAITIPAASSLIEQAKRIEAFEEEYNFERPHEALQMDTPAVHYERSPRRWDGLLRGPEYDTKLTTVRKVGQNGCIWLEQREYFMGLALVGEYIGLTRDVTGNWDVRYGPVALGKLKKEGGLEKLKRKRKKIIRKQ